jgi:hypothetical protein
MLNTIKQTAGGKGSMCYQRSLALELIRVVKCRLQVRRNAVYEVAIRALQRNKQTSIQVNHEGREI